MPIYGLLKAHYVSLMPLDFDLFLFWLLIVTIGDKKQGGDDTAKSSDLGFSLLFLAVSSFLAAHPWCC